MRNFPLKPIWEGRDVYIIGGGPSVNSFPIDNLKSEKVIGCNDAYIFGDEVIDLLLFGDWEWYQVHRQKAHASGIPLITSQPNNRLSFDWDERVFHIRRQQNGFYKDSLGFNGNTGAAAINLALILGAKRVLLVGFDMKLVDGESNWHANDIDSPSELHYDRYRNALDNCVAHWRANWPDTDIINLNPDSALDTFDKMVFDELKGREE